MTLILEKENNKKKCQKFTPEHIVNTMLDLADYKENLVGKTVLESAFGSGNILKAIVIRYIEAAKKEKIDKTHISKGLSEDIYGVELDQALYDICINELNAITAKYGLPRVSWNLYQGDALAIDFDRKFDFIIGNPPYISYTKMDEVTRKRTKEAFKSCKKGKFDYCYAFIESGINVLKEKGRMVQLIPNNIYKNVFAQELREILVDHITSIYDYPNQKLFDDALTSVSIFLYNKTYCSEDVHYKNVTTGKSERIQRRDLKGKWVFSTNKVSAASAIRFGDIFHASVTVATLCNKAYLVNQTSIVSESLEEESIRKTASPKTLRAGKTSFIIFPYKYEKGALIRFSNNEFESSCPNIVKHLQRYSKDLELRDSDKNAAWYEYGRSQALIHLNKEKLLLSAIVTKCVEVYRINAETIPFSGIYITVKDDRYSLDDAIKILKSEQFMEYVREIGISISGQSLRISCKDINDYMFIMGD